MALRALESLYDTFISKCHAGDSLQTGTACHQEWQPWGGPDRSPPGLGHTSAHAQG